MNVESFQVSVQKITDATDLSSGSHLILEFASRHARVSGCRYVALYWTRTLTAERETILCYSMALISLSSSCLSFVVFAFDHVEELKTTDVW